jgi:hypothetical protein
MLSLALQLRHLRVKRVHLRNRAKKLRESSFQKPENGPSKKSAPKKSAPRKRTSRKRPPKDTAKSKWY